MTKKLHNERQIDWMSALEDALTVMNELKPHAENQLGERLHKAIAKAEAAIEEFERGRDFADADAPR